MGESTEKGIKEMMDALILNRLQRAPQRVKDLAGGSDNWLKRRPIRAALNRMEVAGLVRRVRLVGAPYWVPAGWVADGDWLRDYLLGNTVQTADGCMRWAGAMDHGQITTRVDGEKLNVRTELWRLYGRKPLTPGFCVRSVCGDPLCVAREHMVAEAHAAAIRNIPRPVHVRAKIAAGKRVNSKITMTVADEIRASTLSERVLAEKFGVHPSMVGRIRRGENWLSYDGPLGQLVRAA